MLKNEKYLQIRYLIILFIEQLIVIIIEFKKFNTRFSYNCCLQKCKNLKYVLEHLLHSMHKY